MATRAAYATEPDLLIGDVRLGAATNPDTFLSRAADEIDVALSGIYVVPIPPATIDVASTTKLRLINSNIASGLILMSYGSEDGELHAYGVFLLNEGRIALDRLASGQDMLTGVGLELVSSTVSSGPYVKNYDEFSPVDTFYGEYATGRVWRPGST